MGKVILTKMQGKSWAAVFVLLLLLTSCAHSQKDVESDRHFSFVTIPVRFDDSVKEGMKLSDFVEKIEFVLLESTDSCRLYGVGHAELTDQYIYVVDKPVNRSFCVYQFDRKGYFLRRIGTQGEGTDEFVEMSGFALNRETGEINIYDGVRKRVVSYLPDGSFSKATDMFQACSDFEFQNGLFYIYTPPIDGDADIVFVVDEKGNKKAQYLHRPDLGFILSGSGMRKNTGKGVLFCEAFDNTIYTFDKEKIRTKYVFDFGRHTMPHARKKEYLEAIAQSKPIKDQIQLLGDYITEVSDIQETRKWLFFNVVKGIVLYRGIYNKETEDVRLQRCFQDDMYETIGLGEEFVGAMSDGLIATVSSDWSNSALNKILSVQARKGEFLAFGLDNQTVFSEVGSRWLKDGLYNNVGEKLNPMLMIIQFKE